jgi:hypothetical protein
VLFTVLTSLITLISLVFESALKMFCRKEEANTLLRFKQAPSQTTISKRSTILLRDIPTLNNINQVYFTKTIVQPEFKNNLAPSRKLLVTPLHGVSL